MLKKLLLTTTIATFAAPVFASGLSDARTAQPVIAPAPVAVAPAAPAPSQGTDWSGFYLGAQAGTIVDSEETYPGDVTGEFQGNLYGVHAGYLYDLGSVVLGAEASFDQLNITEVSLSGPTGTDTETVDEDGSVTRFGLRAGYDAGSFLPYLTAGVATVNLAEFDELDGTSGTFFGGGAMIGVTESILLTGQVLQHAFDTDVDTQVTTVSIRASYKF